MSTQTESCGPATKPSEYDDVRVSPGIDCGPISSPEIDYGNVIDPDCVIISPGNAYSFFESALRYHYKSKGLYRDSVSDDSEPHEWTETTMFFSQPGVGGPASEDKIELLRPAPKPFGILTTRRLSRFGAGCRIDLGNVPGPGARGLSARFLCSTYLAPIISSIDDLLARCDFFPDTPFKMCKLCADSRVGNLGNLGNGTYVEINVSFRLLLKCSLNDPTISFVTCSRDRSVGPVFEDVAPTKT